MTVARRLAALETSLSPTQRILAWLDEAHAFGTLNSYVESLLDQSPDAFPINRLAWETASATRTALRGKPPEVVNPAVRKALRDTIFRFDLVMRINTVTHEMVDREQLLYLVFAGQLAILTSDDRRERRVNHVYLERIGQCRDLAFGRVNELMAAEEALSIAEQRYLEGHAARFPDGARQLSECLHQAQELAVMAERVAGHAAPGECDRPGQLRRKVRRRPQQCTRRARPGVQLNVLRQCRG